MAMGMDARQGIARKRRWRSSRPSYEGCYVERMEEGGRKKYETCTASLSMAASEEY